MPRRFLTAREQFEMREPWLRTADVDSRHRDLLESEHLYGTAHTTGGRVLPQGRIAATPEEQEARLAEPTGWTHHVAFPPSQRAIAGARQYAAARGMGDPHDVSYQNVMQDPETVRQTGRAYDALPEHDPNAIPHYEAFRREVNDQYDHLTKNLGINVQPVDHDPYPDAQHMVNDVDNNNRLQVLGTHITGGHPYLSDAENDKFRAVHDYFGHAATGRSFDRHGEQAAFNAHSKMFSPQALPALASETRGQNSSLILNGQFPPQKIATLPEYQQQKVARRPQNDDEFDRSLMKSLHDDGGTTFRENIGDGPTSGYMVSQTPDNRLPAETFRPEQVREVRDQNRPRLKQHPDEYNGIWSQPDGVYHEISKNHPGYYDAIKDAYDRDQIALYDLGYGTDIDTAATQYNGQPGIYMARSWFV